MINIQKIFASGIVGLLGLFIFIEPISSQELLVGLDQNIQLQNQYPGHSVHVHSVKSNLELPFIDDFAQHGHQPKSRLWQNSSGVYINNNFAINPPSIGVATFDPFDSKGKLYPQASSRVFEADTLCSQPINLGFNAADSIYLSFLFQPQGYGDMPEENDIFILQFYSPTLMEWETVWTASVRIKDSSIIQTSALFSLPLVQQNQLGSRFYQAQIGIVQPRFLTAGFQFRFINYASIAVHPAVTGRSTASDHWHLDYVYLDKNRASANTNIPDIGIAEVLMPQISRYQSIPASHLNNNEAQNELFPDPLPISIVYQNMGWGTKSVIRNYRINSLYGIGGTVNETAGSENIDDFERISFPNNLNRYTLQANADSAAYQIQTFIVTDNDPSSFRAALRHNDTTTYTQWFRDYYAYDDGSAENGYGLYGQGTAGGKIAVKFYNYKKDSIRGAYIYFNQTIANANKDEFRLAIWEDDGSGKPGRLIHSEAGGRPEFTDQINQYMAYKFSKPIAINNLTTYFVGWIQSTDNFLNIGFDRNQVQQQKNYYQIGANWEPTAFAGSVMLRPIYCRADQFPKEYIQLGNQVNPKPKLELDYIAYPNPVTDFIYFKEFDNNPLQISRIEVFDLLGRRLLQQTALETSSIDLSKYKSGIYIIKIWTGSQIRAIKRIEKP